MSQDEMLESMIGASEFELTSILGVFFCVIIETEKCGKFVSLDMIQNLC